MAWKPEWFWAPVAAVWLAALILGSTRRAIGDGWRCLARYPILWKLPAALAFIAGLVELAWAVIFHWRSGTDFPLYLRAPLEIPSFPEMAPYGLIPALEILATMLNCLLTPFPLSVLCALLLLVNYRGLARELGRTLYRRFGWWYILLGALLAVCLLADLAKPLCLLAGPHIIQAITYPHFILLSTGINALAFAFEYVVGTCLQLYLLLLAYSWVRGLQFDSDRLLPFAVRRLGLVMKWALVIVAATAFFFFLPLLLASSSVEDPAESRVFLYTDYVVRPLLALATLSMATVQIHLALHNDTLRGAVRGHLEFLRHSAARCFLFLLAAFASLLVLKTIESIGESYLGESLAGEAWKILCQTVVAGFGGWVLAAWVCFYTGEQRALRHPTI